MNPIQTLMRRARSYWFIDGFWEIGLGLTFLLNGLAFLASSIPFILPATLLFTSIAGRFLVRRLKESLTYPRTGYAGGQPFSPADQKLMIGALLLLGLLSCVFFPGSFILYLLTEDNAALSAGRVNLLNLSTTLLPLLFSGIVAVFLFLQGREYHLPRFYLLALLSALMGGGLFLAALARGLYAWEDLTMLARDLGTYSLFMGLVMLGSGLLTFRAYQRRNPNPALMEEVQ